MKKSKWDIIQKDFTVNDILRKIGPQIHISYSYPICHVGLSDDRESVYVHMQKCEGPE